jgi:ABC-2 type transport system ATP-binding protein
MPAAETHEGTRRAPRGDARSDGGDGAAIVVRDLTKVYPVQFARLRKFFRRKSAEPVEALRGVTLDVGAGEIFGLIGRNGAGKTTFTKIIATLVQPSAGSVTVRGFDSVKDEGRVRAQVGLASAEERSFYWRLTVEQNLLFFARLYGMGDRAARARIAELVALFELETLARRRFGQLSTGNKQRVIVARAMLSDPPILLLDEPTRSLDPLAAAEMRAAVRKLAAGARPKTILLTSHNLAEIEELCDRVAIISGGSIRALDTPRALRSRHKPTERARLIVRGAGLGGVERALRPLALVDFAARESGDDVVAEFTREVDDPALDLALGALREAGGAIVSVDAERATLLDVLEGYERPGGEVQAPAAGGVGNEGAGA